MLMFENPGDFVAAESATTVLDIPFAELAPIALDEQFTATRTLPKL
jgi:hypothetical protein